MQTDRQWVEMTWSEHDADRGPITRYQVRARFPGQRWRQIAMVRRLDSAEATHEAITMSAANVAEPIVEVLAFTARGRQPESVKSPWHTGAHNGDPMTSSVEVDELDLDGDATVVMARFHRASMKAHEQERSAYMRTLERQVELMRADVDYWRQAAMESIRMSGGQLPPTLQQTERSDRVTLASEVVGGLQAIATTVAGAVLGGSEGPIKEAAKAWLASLDKQQLAQIADVLRPTQTHALLVLAAMVEGREPPKASPEDLEDAPKVEVLASAP